VIIKTKWTESYTVVPNAIFEAGLSAQAVGTLCYLIGRPDDWKVSAAELGKKFFCGRQRMNKIMQEIERAGYASRRVGGKSGGFDWIVCDKPTVAKPDSRKTRQSQNRPLLSKENIQSTEKEQSTEKDIGHSDERPFESFWSLYPKKVAKQTAEKTWSKLPSKDKDAAIEDLKEGRYANTEKQFVPNPPTYLNGRRWEDERINNSIESKFL
jgi:DNA replication protein DnaC